MKKSEKYRETKNARYALKHIKEDYHVNRDSRDYIQATRYVYNTCQEGAFIYLQVSVQYAHPLQILHVSSDLALEAEFLASLQHPNIIKLRGITHSGASALSDGPG